MTPGLHNVLHERHVCGRTVFSECSPRAFKVEKGDDEYDQAPNYRAYPLVFTR